MTSKFDASFDSSKRSPLSAKDSRWIQGKTRSGKSARLVETLSEWHQTIAQSVPMPTARRVPTQGDRGFLVFAANGENRIELVDRIEAQTQGRSLFDSTTPLGFFQSELLLFWPLVAEQLQLNVQFPLRLRPETEQMLATRLWQPRLDRGELAIDGVRDYYVVRRILDLLQIAASTNVPVNEIALVLTEGYGDQRLELWNHMGDALQEWQRWCLQQGLLTYGLISDLYGRVLLRHEQYRYQLRRRYQAVLADDVDDYPAIAHDLFDVLLNLGLAGCFTYNPRGALRQGLGADPEELAQLAHRCQVELRTSAPEDSLGATWGSSLWQRVSVPLSNAELPDAIQSIQTVSRAALLRQTAEVIQTAVQQGQVEPKDIAILGPGLDAIARYTLREILSRRGIAVTVLNDQQPLSSSPTIRALMTLMALVYPGLGRLIDRDAISEMLVVLSQRPGLELSQSVQFAIDPVRAGLLTDYCFRPDPTQPMLLPVTVYDRWDRLGYQATESYKSLSEWVQEQQQQQQQRLISNPVVLLDRAIQQFLFGGSHLPYDQLAALRELMETAQHFWDVDARLRQTQRTDTPVSDTVEAFIHLLQGGTITADPYPVRRNRANTQAVTLATLYQYRANRSSHRWQFWLDAGSTLWLSGGTPLFGAPLFWRHRPNQLWSATEEFQINGDRLQRNLLDLMGRTTERIFLCHSDLATTGQEQNGPLMGLVNTVSSLDPKLDPSLHADDESPAEALGKAT